MTDFLFTNGSSSHSYKENIIEKDDALSKEEMKKDKI
jgi:hypothetical protein